MFGIRGLGGLGLVHAAVGLVALALGLRVVLEKKGTRRHRRLGRAYVAGMVLLNATAFAIYDLYGRFGPFHVAALVSLATVAAAFIPVFTRRPRRGWLELHAHFMGWSYVGLVAAFIAEVAVRIPGLSFGLGVVGGIAVAMAFGGFVIHTRVPKTIGTLEKRRIVPNLLR